MTQILGIIKEVDDEIIVVELKNKWMTLDAGLLCPVLPISNVIVTFRNDVVNLGGSLCTALYVFPLGS